MPVSYARGYVRVPARGERRARRQLEHLPRPRALNEPTTRRNDNVLALGVSFWC